MSNIFAVLDTSDGEEEVQKVTKKTAPSTETDAKNKQANKTSNKAPAQTSNKAPAQTSNKAPAQTKPRGVLLLFLFFVQV